MRPHTASVAFVLVTLGIDALGIGIVIPIVPDLVRTLSHLDAGSAALWVGRPGWRPSPPRSSSPPPCSAACRTAMAAAPVIVISLFGVAVNYLLLAWAPSLSWLFLGRLCAGATAASASAANAYIADVTPRRSCARNASAWWVRPSGRASCSALRSEACSARSTCGCRSWSPRDWRWPMPRMGALLLPESLPVERRRRFSWRRANPVGSLRTLKADPAVARLAFAWCCMWFGLGSLQSSFVLSTGLRFGWGPRENGWAFAAVGISQALVQGLLVRPVIRRLGERRSAFAGFTLSAASYAVFGFAWQGWMIYLGVLLQGFGAVATPAMRGLLSANAGPDRQGEMQGGLSSVEGLTAIISPVAASALFTYATLAGGASWSGAPFLLAAAAYGVAMVVLRRALPRG